MEVDWYDRWDNFFTMAMGGFLILCMIPIVIVLTPFYLIGEFIEWITKS